MVTCGDPKITSYTLLQTPRGDVSQLQGGESIIVPRLKRVSEGELVEIIKSQSVVIIAEAFPYWLLGLDRYYVTSISFYGYFTFDQLFASQMEDSLLVPMLRQLITRIGL